MSKKYSFLYLYPAIIFVVVLFDTVISLKKSENKIKQPTWEDKDIELNEPFILENQGEFYAQADPVEYRLLFGDFQFIYKGDHLKVYCPADKESNIVTKFSKVSLIKTDEIVNVKPNSEIYSINYLCDRMLIPQTVRGQDDYAECQHYSVGYQIYSEEKLNIVVQLKDLPENFYWISYIFYCYDENRLNAIYATEIVTDFKILPRSQEKITTIDSYIWPDKFESVYTDKFENFFKPITQELIFKEIFRKRYVNYFNLERDLYLVKQELVDQKNHQLPMWKAGALFYLNIAPMYKCIKDNAWKAIENYIRLNLRRTLTTKILTGTYGTLTLEGKGLHLNTALDDSLRVPEIFYKIIEVTIFDIRRSICIIVHNNPFAEPKELSCDTPVKCEDKGWIITRKDHELGYSYCCALSKKLMQKFRINDFEINPILNLNNIKQIIKIQSKRINGKADDADVQLLSTL